MKKIKRNKTKKMNNEQNKEGAEWKIDKIKQAENEQHKIKKAV